MWRLGYHPHMYFITFRESLRVFRKYLDVQIMFVSVFELRAEAITLENDYQTKRRELKMESQSLEDLDSVLASTKDRMENNIKQYDELYKKLQDITHQLEKQKNVNIKIDDDLIKRRAYVFSSEGVEVEDIEDDFWQAYEQAIRLGQKTNKPVFVTGSLYLVGAVLERLQMQDKEDIAE